MISVVILESRSPGSVVITRGHPEQVLCKVCPTGFLPFRYFKESHPELVARRVFRIYRLGCLLYPFDVLFLKCFDIKFVVN